MKENIDTTETILKSDPKMRAAARLIAKTLEANDVSIAHGLAAMIYLVGIFEDAGTTFSIIRNTEEKVFN